jgi:acyl-CoA thioester hydrolase
MRATKAPETRDAATPRETPPGSDMPEVPILAWTGIVEPEWIDFNDHMSSAEYARLFHPNTGALFRRIGIGPEYIRTRRLTVFQREFRVSYERELRVGEQIEIRSYLVAHDAKRIHHAHELWHRAKGIRAAFVEYMSLHFDMKTRRLTPFPEDVMECLDTLALAFAAVSPPPGVGQAIGIRPRRQ